MFDIKRFRMDHIAQLISAPIVTRQDLLDLPERIRQENAELTIMKCVESVKKEVIEVASTGSDKCIWKNVRAVIARQFNVQACEISEELSNQLGDEIVSRLKKVFPDCNVERVISRSMFDEIIADSIKISWLSTRTQ
jgi:hypothetical protein